MPDPIRGVNTPDPVAPTLGSAATAPSPGYAGAVSAAAPAADLADVGETEALLQTIIQVASSTPGIDQGKVDSLRQAIASGAYQVNPQSIAQRIVELDAQLGTAGNLQ